MFSLLFALVMQWIVGAAIATLFWLFRINKVLKKTRTLVDENGVLLSEVENWPKEDAEGQKLKMLEVSQNLTLLKGRLEATGELLGR